jgi:hypothetical protein
MRFELLRTNEVNLNGRLYTKEAAEKMVSEFNKLKERGTPAYGQMGMDSGTEISLSKISHVVNDLEFDGQSLYGEIQVLDTDAGKKLKLLLDEGQVAFRSRSIGRVNEDGTVEIDKVISYDAIPIWNDAFSQENKYKYLLIEC